MPGEGCDTLQNSEEKRVLALQSLQFKLSMQNKDTDGMQKQTLDGENERSDDWTLSGEKNWVFEGAFGTRIYYAVTIFLKVCLSLSIKKHLLLNWDESLLNAFQLKRLFQQSILKQTCKQVLWFEVGWWGFGGVFFLFCIFFLTLSCSWKQKASCALSGVYHSLVIQLEITILAHY